MRKYVLLLLWSSFGVAAFAQQSLLQSGPMLGYSEMREALIWVQTKESASVKAAYWEIDSLGNAVGKDTFYTATAVTKHSEAFTAHLIANKIQPSKKYGYQVFINHQPLVFDYPTQFESQPLWQWRHQPPNFKLALGSCAYVSDSLYDRPGKPYGGDYFIFEKMADHAPNMMLWLGDNTYLREADWFTTTGMHHRHTHTRSLPEMQRFLAATHHYAIWDDHDFGPNDSDGSFVHKDKALAAFQNFWGNPSYGVNGEKGITSMFQFYDIDFFLLDNRYHRTANRQKKGHRQILGKAQIEWLVNALAASHSPFKMVAVGGQVVNTAAVFENFATFPEERAYLLKRLEEENIKGVIFLTGDRHHTELSKYESENGWKCYDLTVSPLTSGAGGSLEEPNKNRVEGTMVVKKRNFAMVDVFGKFRARKLNITVFDNQNNQLWEYTISEDEF